VFNEKVGWLGAVTLALEASADGDLEIGSNTPSKSAKTRSSRDLDFNSFVDHMILICG